MAEHVISHRAPRRKRGKRSFMLRRFGVLAVTVAALAVASWLASNAGRPIPPPTKVAEPRTNRTTPPPGGTTEVTLLITAEQPATEPPRPRRARRGVPLNANSGDMGEDFEVLSAHELDAISQARN